LSAGFHNVMGYYRDDLPLQELILDEKGKQELERLWEEFDFIADYTTRTYVQYFFNQSGEVRGKGRESGTERPPDSEVVAEPVIGGLEKTYLARAQNPISIQAINEHFDRVNATIRKVERERSESEPHHLDALVKFAAKAYRRPLTPKEKDGIFTYYHQLRSKDGLSHEDAMRDSLTAILMSPEFCYRIDLVDTNAKLTAAADIRPISDAALASRLSYFLWSSIPDAELTAHATAGDLHRPDVILAQARRMLKDERARGIATEFGGNWLDFRHFEDINTVDRERFPSFDNDLREAMFQEPIHFLTELIRTDRPVLDLLFANYTFVNPLLAKHYGMPIPDTKPDVWMRVDNANVYGRGGLLPMAVFLTQNAPGLRTSPVKRGYWVARRVLGEVIPPPPPVVPELPHDESKMDLPLRAMLERHRANTVCAACHARFDSFGLIFENYGPVGEKRTEDLAGHAISTQANFPGGSEGEGLDGLKSYIRQHRQNDFLDGLNRKLLAYALNRSLQLSDEPLVDKMRARLTEQNYRFAALVEIIVTSPQFLNKRISEPKSSTQTADVRKVNSNAR
jgi:hypothetical protein